MAADEVDAPDILIRLLPLADVDRTEEDRLKALVCERAKAKPRSQERGSNRPAPSSSNNNNSPKKPCGAGPASRADRRIRLPAPAPEREVDGCGKLREASARSPAD
jgi:hypothetical protein